MEVHHKHHAPKNWKEYITEFLMLFAAVTLGFFAENYREHQIIDHRMEENYQALVQDLKQDSSMMQQMFQNNIQERKALLKLLDLLYRHHDGKIDTKQVQEEIFIIERFPSYLTLFMNNTTFKNMQSSGMLSYVDDKELRKDLSFYYEVLFKKLIDNNQLYDEDGRKFYTEMFPMIQPPANRQVDSLIGTDVELSVAYRSSTANKKFILNLPFSRDLLSDPKTLFGVEAFYQRFNVYSYLIMTLQNENRKLLKRLNQQNASH